MKVTIREWNAVAAWRWDMPDDDVCGICRNPYDSTCSKCKFPGDECPLLLGECNHSFHMAGPSPHCIFSWLKQESSQEKCPMCRQPFKSKSQEAPAAIENQDQPQQPDTSPI
ncbi:anaphase-promoting complex subunit 11 [Pyrenochaeta sp. MPI-SDFR-AT-0127]|nr:anaphase-promoting complex subunit 11 [Pyrenochaeta sp. MPI-SDFR-AT-0127]